MSNTPFLDAFGDRTKQALFDSESGRERAVLGLTALTGGVGAMAFGSSGLRKAIDELAPSYQPTGKVVGSLPDAISGLGGSMNGLRIALGVPLAGVGAHQVYQGAVDRPGVLESLKQKLGAQKLALFESEAGRDQGMIGLMGLGAGAAASGRGAIGAAKGLQLTQKAKKLAPKAQDPVADALAGVVEELDPAAAAKAEAKAAKKAKKLLKQTARAAQDEGRWSRRALGGLGGVGAGANTLRLGVGLPLMALGAHQLYQGATRERGWFERLKGG